MNILFNHLVSNHLVSQFVSLFKNKLSNALSPLQTKVVLVALTIFSGLTCAYLIHRRYFKSNQMPKKLNIQERLAKNRKFAEEQRMAENSKSFVLAMGDTPDVLSIHNKNKTLIGQAKTVNGKDVGIASCEGNRSEMEDADLALDVKDQKYPFEVFGIFDGHGGSDASAFVKENLATYLTKALEQNNSDSLTEEGIFKALKACFIKLDEDFPQMHSGTTATVAIILAGKLWVANTGDSRQFFVQQNGTVVQSTQDTKPDIPRYKKKIEKLGGFVAEMFVMGSEERLHRVNGKLGVARAIGDKDVIGSNGKCCISPNPKITCYSLDELKGGYFVLACDGLYDVASSNEVGQAIYEMHAQRMTPEQMAKRLVHSAIECKSKDNVSVMVVKVPA